MTPRLWALSLAPILAAQAAYAQAPGEVDPTTAPPPPPPPAAAPAPGAAPAPAGPCGYAPAAIPVMENRWAIGVAFGGMGVAPDGAPDGSEARFRVAQLAVRYRAARRIELELAMSGGRQVAADSTDGELATGTVALALRYRFMPERRWNWFVLGGLGATVIAPHTSNADERDAAQRPIGMLGVGIERRFRRLALQAELRAVGTGPRKDASGGDTPVVVNGGPTPTMPPALLPPPDSTAATTYADKLSGGTFTLGASYYF